MIKYDINEIKEFIKECYTKADLCRKLGLKPTGGNYRVVDNFIKENNLDITHFLGRSYKKGKHVKGTKKYSLEEIMVENSPIKNNFKLKERLIKNGLKEYKCELCGFTDKVELHHKNGNHRDNRLENLQMLCPNCHSKTPNFRIKNNYDNKQEYNSLKNNFLTEKEIKKRKTEREKNHNRHPLIKEIKQICSYCGKEFYNTAIQTYCSMECYNKDRSKNRPSIIELISSIRELKNFTKVGKKYNVSANGVVKWCKLYKIPYRLEELKEYIEKYFK